MCYLLLVCVSLQVLATPVFPEGDTDDPKSRSAYQAGWQPAKADIPLKGVFLDGFIPGALTFFTAYGEYTKLINAGLEQRLQNVPPEDVSDFTLGYSDYVDKVVLPKAYRGALVGTVTHCVFIGGISWLVGRYILIPYMQRLVPH